jgi:hypothetical protein
MHQQREAERIMAQSIAGVMGQALRDRQEIERIAASMNFVQSSYLPSSSFFNPELFKTSQLVRDQLAAFDFTERSKTFEALSVGHSKVIQGIVESQQRLETLTKSAMADLGRALNLNSYVDSILTSIEASARINLKLDGNLFIPALQHVRAFQEFSERQVKALSHEREELGERRVIITNLGGELAEACHTAHGIGIALSDDIPQEIYPVAPNLYGRLNSSLAFTYRSDIKVDTEIAFRRSVPSRIAELGIAIAGLIHRINESVQRSGKPAIFKPTSRCLIACAQLPTLIVRDRDDFAQIVDYLFFLLYEGSGTDKCRLLDIVDDSDLKPLWRVKHLRLDFRHDIEHGKIGDIASKHKKIGAAYEALIGKGSVTERKEWVRAQLRLYEQLYDMLRKVHEKAGT